MIKGGYSVGNGFSTSLSNDNSCGSGQRAGSIKTIRDLIDKAKEEMHEIPNKKLKPPHAHATECSKPKKSIPTS
jgi:hypothetical protein